MLKIRRPLGRLIFNMGIAIPGKTVFLIETAPRIFQDNLVNTIAADALATCVARSSATMVLNMLYKQDIASHKEGGFQVQESSQCWKIIGNTYMDGLVQDCRNSVAKPLELMQSCMA